ncbi:MULTISPECIES: divergent polysaccharide deacetylase family protein [unclassified Campylobacter]|uniref:divergent polysaccharide deacetylase family protein n=1 Tax=unclassified Campylobacter TaxID=2593542 RepID=UPI001237B1A2|nr:MULTISPECIES: divergent polysaccharide deacetylase family protein [unclassified Campylobacter]KAA6225345.1 divergent polysaccharide deacetylase family protein [Campylobacter sp. LR185c]KAA6227041.1 divergent polysaccharide deacetylase family protein [Campylobacter sp. LR196d]KAA6227612.1 divergent polysaccharide deacetylase family protein [Campylobacter sp. LR286c]KAA6230722.1 divergent polysaccharide deacetylase family protein [Campylobacter sp. LR291e]KAA8604962.1 hypothetical protein CGP
MSKSTLIKIQRLLIIAILFLLCVALSLAILIKYQKQQVLKDINTTQSSLSLENKNQNLDLNKTYKQDFFIDINQSSKISILEQVIMDENLSIQENNISLENNDENLSQVVEEIKIDEKIEEEIQKDIKHKNAKIDKKNPKLVLIIDDISNIDQINEFKKLNLKFTPSIFPSDNFYKDTHKLTKNLKFYMVHLPLAAINYESKLDTLHPNDSQDRINKKIADIKKNFKGVKFINNHTGSLFTSDEKAMKKLYRALDKHNLRFVDSLTTPNSKVEKIAKQMGHGYIQRDVFLDDINDIAVIKKQIKEAVMLAKKNGFAIAIAHPKKNTILALKESKKLLNSIKLVYLSEIYE